MFHRVLLHESRKRRQYSLSRRGCIQIMPTKLQRAARSALWERPVVTPAFLAKRPVTSVPGVLATAKVEDRMRACLTSTSQPTRCQIDELTSHFAGEKREAEESLRFVENTSWFRLREITPQGRIDITEQHKQSLLDQCAEYQRMLESLNLDLSLG
jgi:hypothetical protein